MSLRFDVPTNIGGQLIFDDPEGVVSDGGDVRAQAASVAGVGLKVGGATIELTAANDSALKDVAGAVAANLVNAPWEFYNDPLSTTGEPADTGTLNTNASGEATVVVTEGVILADGEYGQLIVYHPSDSDIRATYRVPVIVA